MLEQQQTVVNTTEANNNFTDGVETSSEKATPSNDTDEEILLEQRVDEDDIENIEDAESPSISQW